MNQINTPVSHEHMIKERLPQNVEIKEIYLFTTYENLDLISVMKTIK